MNINETEPASGIWTVLSSIVVFFAAAQLCWSEWLVPPLNAVAIILNTTEDPYLKLLAGWSLICYIVPGTVATLLWLLVLRLASARIRKRKSAVAEGIVPSAPR